MILCTGSGPTDEAMSVGFVRLVDLLAMYKEMGQRFFERNIRAGLNERRRSTGRLLRRSSPLSLMGPNDPRVFAFTITASPSPQSDWSDRTAILKVTEPRLLNGAQTVTTYARFLALNEGNTKVKEREPLPPTSGCSARYYAAKPDSSRR